MDNREYKLRIAELRQRKWEAEYQAKGDVEAQGFKGVVLINGGAAIALGALLQALVNKSEAATFIPYVLTGITFSIVGVAAGSVIFWVRYMQNLYEKKHNKFFRENPWWIWRWYLGGGSIFCFVIGMGVVTWGGFTQLTLDPPPTLSSSSTAPLAPSVSPPLPSNPTVDPDVRKSGARGSP